jgi:oligoribonuclease
MSEDQAPPPLIWIDMEMSGLDPGACAILEIAVIVTDGDLAEIAEGPDIVVHQPDGVLDAMDEWNIEHHGKSGLIARVKASVIDVEAAEAAVLDFLAAHTEPGISPLAGNSVHQDRAFIDRHMPLLAAYLHYRNVDVSTVKELSFRWYPALPRFEKAEAHRALSDIRESLAELRHYRENIFRER